MRTNFKFSRWRLNSLTCLLTCGGSTSRTQKAASISNSTETNLSVEAHWKNSFDWQNKVNDVLWWSPTHTWKVTWTTRYTRLARDLISRMVEIRSSRPMEGRWLRTLLPTSLWRMQIWRSSRLWVGQASQSGLTFLIRWLRASGRNSIRSKISLELTSCSAYGLTWTNHLSSRIWTRRFLWQICTWPEISNWSFTVKCTMFMDKWCIKLLTRHCFKEMKGRWDLSCWQDLSSQAVSSTDQCGLVITKQFLTS